MTQRFLHLRFHTSQSYHSVPLRLPASAFILPLQFRPHPTDTAAAYGTPEMAASITRLLCEMDLRQHKIFAIHGHREGVFAFGETLEEAESLILAQLMNAETL